ncbi:MULTISPECIES: hypothetical protein [Pseudomonas]|uniref:Uncharacterized protein n=1 Tax=Ectopseudomonas oleovorans TaxID=301 RepID=A0A653B091_ECTOL|nr:MULTISPECIES: hypothetical protein [unclassified Pseudomonas]WFC63629.1 hypothetical protein EWH21_18530 [Pseudomonas sp. REST10]CAE6948760.1 conserved membrane protein of unknown function [Pseudomonas oleovorans]|tara:strand:- start:5680 stop:6135 length:456 start_codon:yes stop_codon:yes gene_type:complete
MDVQQDNPFQTPQADLQQASASTLPLYRIAAVGLGTFLGTPLAGAWMLAHNLQLLGKADRVAMVWGVAVCLLALTLALAFVLPEEVPTLPFAIGQLLGMVMLAKHLTEADIQQHAAAGGTFLSNWRAAGIAVLFSIAVMALLFAVLMILDV